MNSKIMIYSSRPSGYRQAGVLFTRAPMAITVVDTREHETAGDALARRKRGDWTVAELAGVDRVIEDAKRSGKEPALAKVDSVSEAAAVDRKLVEKRAQLDTISRMVEEAAIAKATADAEVEAAKRQIAETMRELAEERDRLSSARNKLAESEARLGKVRAQAKEIGELKAEIARLKAAAEK
jgi:chromosome segregation ATPase